MITRNLILIHKYSLQSPLWIVFYYLGFVSTLENYLRIISDQNFPIGITRKMFVSFSTLSCANSLSNVL